MKKLLLLLVLTFFVFFPMVQGECYTTLKYKNVPLDFGKVKMPMDLYVVELYFQDILKVIETDNRLVELEKSYIGISIEEALKNVKIYQVGIDDGNSYKVAFFMTLFTNIEDYPSEISVKDKEIIVKEINNLVLFYKGIGVLSSENKFVNQETVLKIDMFAANTNAELSNITLINPDDFNLRFTTINNKPAYSFDWRVGLEGLGVYATRIYTFNSGKKTNNIILFSLDSEREFWQNIFDNTLGFNKEVTR